MTQLLCSPEVMLDAYSEWARITPLSERLRDDTISDMREIIKGLQLQGLIDVVLYGSHKTGVATEESFVYSSSS